MASPPEPHACEIVTMCVAMKPDFRPSGERDQDAGTLPPVPDPVPSSSPAEALLMRVALFAGLGRVELARLAAHLEPIEYAPGVDVVKQGDPGDGLYVVEHGKFAVLMATPASPEARVSTLAAGDVFGEM